MRGKLDIFPLWVKFSSLREIFPLWLNHPMRTKETEAIMVLIKEAYRRLSRCWARIVFQRNWRTLGGLHCTQSKQWRIELLYQYKQVKTSWITVLNIQKLYVYFVYFKLYVYFVYFKLYVYSDPRVRFKNNPRATPIVYKQFKLNVDKPKDKWSWQTKKKKTSVEKNFIYNLNSLQRFFNMK